MTDISNWRESIHIRKTRDKNVFSGEPTPHFVERLMIPMNQYQMANLLDALTQSRENGDWYGEFCDIVHAAMLFMGLKELRANSGKVFTLEDVANRLKVHGKDNTD